MSIFGELDALEIPSNIYFIAEGEYTAEVVKALYKTNRDGERQLQIEYQIDDENSEYFGKKISKFYTLVPEDMTQEKLSLLPADEIAKIREQMSRLKKDLCGNSTNSSQKGLGVDPRDLNDPAWKPDVLVGTKVNMGVSNWGQDNEGVNWRWANLRSE